MSRRISHLCSNEPRMVRIRSITAGFVNFCPCLQIKTTQRKPNMVCKPITLEADLQLCMLTISNQKISLLFIPSTSFLLSYLPLSLPNTREAHCFLQHRLLNKWTLFLLLWVVSMSTCMLCLPIASQPIILKPNGWKHTLLPIALGVGDLGRAQLGRFSLVDMVFSGQLDLDDTHPNTVSSWLWMGTSGPSMCFGFCPIPRCLGLWGPNTWRSQDSHSSSTEACFREAKA